SGVTVTQFDQLISRLERMIDRVEAVLPSAPPQPDWSASAFRWRNNANGQGYLHAVKNPHEVLLDSLQNVERQKQAILRNTAQFVAGHQANNVLLTGARGTGKSTLIKACWNHFAEQGLKLIEVDKIDLLHLPDIVDLIGERPENFIIFCDDLSFEEGEITYKALKSVLDGSISAPTANMLFYATSNRRHLLPQKMRENLDVSYEDGEIRPNDTTEEKISLRSERSEKFIIFCDDLSFAEGEITYTALKSVLDGSISAPTANMLFYATSNRRHLLPQKMRENLDVSYEDGEIRPNDTTEEKVSL